MVSNSFEFQRSKWDDDDDDDHDDDDDDDEDCRIIGLQHDGTIRS